MLSPHHVAPSPKRVLDGLPTLSTADPDEARERIGSLFVPHGLRPLAQRGGVRMKLRSTGPGFGVHLLDYGTAVQIKAGVLNSFFMVQLPLAGKAQLEVGSRTIESTPTLASVPPIDRDFSMTWDAGTPQLIVTAPKDALTRAASALYGADLHSQLQLAPSLDVSTPAGKAFVRAVYDFHDLVNDRTRTPNAYVLRLQQETLLAHWLMAVGSNFSSALGQWDAQGTEKGSSALVRDFSALLETHSSEELAVGDLAEALGVSVRTLQVAVARHANSTPSEMLREARLDRAHRLLLEADPRSANVTQIADECGFGHLGRFAQVYKRRFGQAPSETLRESSGRAAPRPAP